MFQKKTTQKEASEGCNSQKAVASKSSKNTADSPFWLQTKLNVASANNVYEQEADAIANQVMRQPTSHVQRRCACGGIAGADGECAACKAKRLQRETANSSASSSVASGSEAPASVHQTLAQPGQALNTATRHFMESRYGQDFSHVRVHTDAQAAQSAADVDARAYTVGNKVVFGAGQYQPQSASGQHLLAHELAHVVQQNSSKTLSLQRQQHSNPETNVHLSSTPTGVPYEKWSERVEQEYRRSGDVVRADAVRACRTQGGAACSRLLTLREVDRLYGLAVSAQGDRAAVQAGLAGAAPVLAPPSAPAPPTPVRPPLRLVPPPTTVPTPTPTPGPTPRPVPGAAVGPAILVTIMVLAGIQLWQMTKFQTALREQGFIILENPLGQCIRGCHQPAQPRPPAFDFPELPRADLERWLRERQPTPQPTPGPGTDTAPRSEPQEREDRDNCFQQNPGALPCTDFREREEIVADFLMNEGFSPFDLGDCYGVNSFAPNTIYACLGAPGESWHCRVNGTTREVSIFGCLCCNEDGSTNYEWRAPHWSTNLSRRG